VVGEEERRVKAEEKSRVGGGGERSWSETGGVSSDIADGHSAGRTSIAVGDAKDGQSLNPLSLRASQDLWPLPFFVVSVIAIS